MLYFFDKKNAPEFIIIGLGNPGKEYVDTRHNVGFLFVDYLSELFNQKIKGKKFNSLFYKLEIENKKILILKPETFMNLSGEALKKAMKFYKIPSEKIIVVFDDINFDVGKIRIRKKGSHGGHNGMKNIIENLNTENLKRVKIGVGKKPSYYNLANWVLSRFSKEEKKILEDVFSECFLEIKTLLNESLC